MSAEKEEQEFGEESLPSDYADALRKDKKEGEEELKELSDDYKADYSQYLKERDKPKEEDNGKDELIRDYRSGLDLGNKESAPSVSQRKVITKEEPIERTEKEEVNLKQETTKKEKSESKEEVNNPEEAKKPEEIKPEETKKIDLEAKQEKEARTERAIENLKDLFDNKNKLLAQKNKQDSLSYKFKTLFGAKDGEPVTASEYRAVYDEYDKSLGEVESLTGKSKDQIIKEYLSGKERNEDSVENVNKKLDNIEAGLEKNEEGQSKEKKDLIEKLTGIKDERVKFAIKVAIAGGMIFFPVVGIAAGALGMGLGEALIGYSFIHYSTALGLAVGNATFAVGGIGGGGALMHKAIKDFEDKKSRIPQDKKRKQEEIPTPESPISKIEPTNKRKDNNGEVDKKSKDQIIKESLSYKGRNEDSVENVNKNLDNTGAGLKKTEEGESKEKKSIEEDEFSHVKNFGELGDKIGEVISVDSSFDAKDITEKVNHLRRDPRPIDYDVILNTITSDGGLRKKIHELIEEERKIHKNV